MSSKPRRCTSPDTSASGYAYKRDEELVVWALGPLSPHSGKVRNLVGYAPEVAHEALGLCLCKPAAELGTCQHLAKLLHGQGRDHRFPSAVERLVEQLTTGPIRRVTAAATQTLVSAMALGPGNLRWPAGTPGSADRPGLLHGQVHGRVFVHVRPSRQTFHQPT